MTRAQTQAGWVERLFVGGRSNGKWLAVDPEHDHWNVAIPQPPRMVRGVYEHREDRETFRRETVVFGRCFAVEVFVIMGMDLDEAFRLALPSLLSAQTLAAGRAV